MPPSGVGLFMMLNSAFDFNYFVRDTPTNSMRSSLTFKHYVRCLSNPAGAGLRLSRL